MGARISRAAIDSLKLKIRTKLQEVKPYVPKDLGPKASQDVIKAEGWTKYQKEWEDAKKAVEVADQKMKLTAETIAKAIGQDVDKTGSSFVNALSGSSYNKRPFDKKRDERLLELQRQTEPGKEVARLEKLLEDVDLTLELTTSTAEVKEALKEILRQIGE